MRKALITSIPVMLVLLLAFSACFNPTGEEEMAYITINLNTEAARASLWPGVTNDGLVNITHEIFMIEVSDPAFPIEKPVLTMEPGELTKTFSIEPGTYEAFIKAYYKDIEFANDMITNTSMNTFEVALGTPTTVYFNMTQTAGIYSVGNFTEWNVLRQPSSSGWMASDASSGIDNFIIDITGDFSPSGTIVATFPISSGEVTILGNGHTLTVLSLGHLLYVDGCDVAIYDLNLEGAAANNTPLVFINSGKLTMKGSSSVFNNINSTGVGQAGGVRINTGELKMEDDSEIYNNTVIGSFGAFGGGVYMTSGATLTLEGNSSIYDNTANGTVDAFGGGVFVFGTGVFTMKDGAEINNNVLAGSAPIKKGGGVFINFGGTFNMEGGHIHDHTVGVDIGGGVFIDSGGTFTMSGGNIYNNICGAGGGVHIISGGTFTMSGGDIYDNEVNSGSGGGVLNEGTFTMKGGNIYDNIASLWGGGVLNQSGATFNMLTVLSGEAAVAGTGGSITGNDSGISFDDFHNSGTFELDGNPLNPYNIPNGGW